VVMGLTEGHWALSAAENAITAQRNKIHERAAEYLRSPA
jgi:hypothetical protein